MRFLFARYFWWYICAVLLIGIGGWFLWQQYHERQAPTVETTTVKLADVVQTITVSGKIEARQVARLGFPVNGTIQQVYKREGDQVKKDEVIASLTNEAVIAEYNAALESVRFAEQVKLQLERGATAEERAVAATNVEVARVARDRTKTEYDQAILNARKNLLSNELTAYPTSALNDDIPPTVTGNYLCAEEGRYILSVFRSNTDSGYSYYLSGLENGTFNANSDTPQPLGTCGLYIQFSAAEAYRQSDWVIDIPNRRSSSYIALQNTYDTVNTQAAVALKSAEEALTLAERNQALLLAPPTKEALAQASANVEAAKAKLNASLARVSDYTIRAPFDGIISDVGMKIGEPTSPDRTITLIYEGDYNLRARIPEIDIRKITVGDPAIATFDADPSRPYEATISFISPLSTEIGGVAYYEAHISLTDTPPWLREGLNADVVIESERVTSVPTLPKQFIERVDNTAYIYRYDGITSERTSVTTGLIGTDGTTEVRDLPVGTTVALP